MIDKTTPEETACHDLLNEKYETLSEAGRSIFDEANSAAYVENLVYNVCYQPIEFDEAMERMRLAAKRSTPHDHEILAEIVQAGLLAADSIDPRDETIAGHNRVRGDFHFYFDMLSYMINEILQVNNSAPIRQNEE